jgi:hypothetical protein
VKPTVLIVTTTNWVPTARLAVALGKAGFEVEAICPKGHPLEQTRSASRTHAYQGLRPLRSLARAIAAAKPDLVVPGEDLAVRHLHELHRQRESYARGANVSGLELGHLIERSLGPAAAFPITQARTPFMKLAEEEGIRVPSTSVLQSGEEVKHWIERCGLPAVLKADGSSGGEGVRIVRTPAEGELAFRDLHSPPLLARALKRALWDRDRTLLWPSLLRRRPTVCGQAFVAGHEATSAIVCWKGKVLASLHFEVLRKGHAAGHATVVRLIEHPEMASAVEKIVRRMELSGVCGFDFMLETSTGNAYLIEINPRATQVGHLTLGAGRDLPAALYSAVSGQPVRVAPAVTENSTIALFPHEWARDPQSQYLRTGYHDVPWDTPELVEVCIRRSRKQSKWYTRGERSHGSETAPAVAAPVAFPVQPPSSTANRASAENAAATRIGAR